MRGTSAHAGRVRGVLRVGWVGALVGVPSVSWRRWQVVIVGAVVGVVVIVVGHGSVGIRLGVDAR